jgi:hypothetical protein
MYGLVLPPEEGRTAKFRDVVVGIGTIYTMNEVQTSQIYDQLYLLNLQGLGRG